MNEDKNIRKNNEVFNVPENYFDEFQARISDLTSEIKAEEFSLSAGRSKKSLRLAYIIPAFLVILIVGFLAVFDSGSDNKSLASVSTEDIIDFLEEEGVTEDELISFLDLSAEEIDIYQEGDLLEDFEDSDLEDLSSEIDVFNEYL